MNTEDRMIINSKDIDKRLIVNDKPAVVIKSISNSAVVATKINEGTIDLMCHEGEEGNNSLLLKKRMADGMLACEYIGIHYYVTDLSPTGIGNERFEYYNNQLKSHSPFIPFT